MKKLLKISLLIIVLGLAFNRADLAWGGYEEEINDQIKTLNGQISGQKQKISDIQAKQQKYLEAISQKQQEQNTLGNELSIINDRLEKANLEIEATELEIDKTNLEIKKLNIDIRSKDEAISKNKEKIASLLKLMYKQDQVSALEILLLNNSLSDFINQLKYLQNTNEEILNSVEDLQTVKDKLEADQQILSDKQTELGKLKAVLDEQQQALAGEQQNKSYVLQETRQSEKQYQLMLQQAKREQQQAEADISNMEKTMREKLAKLKNGNKLTYDGLAWPVAKNYISATFHDPDYPYRRSIGEHSGIDIRASYGSTLRAAADGYVARVKFDGSKNYAYIMIVHANGLSTVYGHVSGVSVKADDYVVQGQAIGRTGGIPGSPGSGPFCTGPHLHFEVRSNGLPVDPLEYLP
ncbi:MAG TPA: peptidoglycan DD-metalloendopeptidase family protein [bacterium]|nr:peptidoglycan DD-metalloendopeptidase family protein [bacterium]HPT29565.1 peptidoglycan DD-metalloendopeptidase family protein [bacterium]